MKAFGMWGSALGLAIAAAFLAGCAKEEGEGTSGGSGSAGGSLKGKVVVEGSSTVEPITLVAKKKFNEDYPDVDISVAGNGSSNGFKALIAKECDFSDASRPIKDSEVKKCADAGIEFIEVVVAYDGLTIAINKENDFIKQLTVDQLKKIFVNNEPAKTWKDVNPEWPEDEIEIFAPGTASGTYDYFMEVVDKDKEFGMRDSQIQTNEDDKVLVDGVKNNKNAIGFFGFAYYEANKDDLTAVPIMNGDTPVTPSMETINSGEYAPFSRPLFIYVNKESYDKNEVREFVDFFLANIKTIVEEANYVPLPEKFYTLAQQHLDEGLCGTHYWDKDMKKRSGGLDDIYTTDNLVK